MSPHTESREEALIRADMVLDGHHPWIEFEAVAKRFGLDTSFVWTAETFTQYVELYLTEEAE